MKRLFVLLAFLLAACQPAATKALLIDGETIYAAQGNTPQEILDSAGATLGAHDRILLNGLPVSVDAPLPQADGLQLQIRRAWNVTLQTPQGEVLLNTSAFTLGEALREAGISLRASDWLEPPAETPLTGNLTAKYFPARELTVMEGENTLRLYSAAATVGEALAEAGIAPANADQVLPVESSAIPDDGVIRLTRVYEALSLSIESIPYQTESVQDAALPFGQQEIVQPGVEGLSALRTRIRYENGQEVSRATESKVTLREPQKQIVKSGSQISVSQVGGLDYWLATEMYATVYSPCASGTGGCSYGTASGARAGYGIVAVDYSIYPQLAGMRVYIPGYGTATIGDTGGGPIIESALGVSRTKWIDLGFDDGKIVDMTGWVKVYFLAPAPAEIPAFLR
ncbi:MAG: hypothetical protein Fur002_05830 [Anaerolineales bacterium]